MLRLGQKGDTIIEVMMSMAILGLVLGLSYSTASRSLRTAQEAQERAEATRIVESQIEFIRANAVSGSSPSVFNNNKFFCMNTAGAKIDFTNPIPPIDSDDLSVYPSDCKKGNLYHFGVDRYSGVGGSSGPHEYRITVRWESLNGGKNEVLMRYKMVKP